MSTNVQAVEKYKVAAAVLGIDTAPLLTYLNQLDRDKAESKKQALKTTGFVKVRPPVEGREDADPIMYGLFVEGRGTRGDPVCRIMMADSRAPEWFKEALKEEADAQTGMQFRIRIGGISERGRTAYVWPLARDYENSKREWKREKAIQEARPSKLEDCKTVVEMAQLAYQKYGDIYGLTIVKYDAPSMQALMVEKNETSFLYLSKGAEKIWNFTGGIAKGVTTLEKELDANINCRMLSRS